MRLTIRSRNDGDFKFWAPDCGGYIRLESEGRPGTLGDQICDGGEFIGSTLSTNGSVLMFESICRRWYRQYRRRNSNPRIED